MSSYITKIIVVLYFIFFYKTFAEKLYEHCGMSQQKSKILPGALLLQIKDVDLLSCVKECQARITCASINYHSETLNCELNSAIKCETRTKLKNGEGWTFIEKSDWQNNIDFPCGDGKCSSGYTCVAMKSTNTVCMRSGCGEPPKLKNAVFGTTARAYNTTGSYTCIGNYVNYGNLTITCQSNGIWTELEPNNSGCGIPGIGHCTTDFDCQSVVNISECMEGLCVCANHTAFSDTHSVCYTDCKTLYEQSGNTLTNGVYEIQLNGTKLVECDMDKGGWTIIQRNLYDRKLKFDRSFSEFVAGFGSPYKSLWLGLNNMHVLTSSPSQLLIEIRTNNKNEDIYMAYEHFEVHGPDDYVMKVWDVCNITFGYELFGEKFVKIHSYQPFSTKDSDKTKSTCTRYAGSFWFKTNSGCCALCGGNRGFMGYIFPAKTAVYIKFLSMKVIRIA